MDTGRSSSVYSAYSSVRSMPRTSPSELTISVTTRPHPPWRLTRRRNAVSVMPAIGAMAKGDCRLTEPIFMVLVLGPFLVLGSASHENRVAGQRVLVPDPRPALAGSCLPFGFGEI